MHGVILFLLANGINPEVMSFKKKDIKSFKEKIESIPLRLDPDEKTMLFTFFLKEKAP